MYKNFFTRVSILTIFTLLSCVSFADTITTVKGKKVVIELDSNTTLQKGDTFVASKDGKKVKGIISTVKKNKAVGTIKSGKAVTGMTVKKFEGKGSVAKSGKADSEAGESSGPTKSSSLSFGVMGGVAMDTMSVKLSGATANTAGMGFVAKGVLILPMGSSVFVRAGLGMETFSAEDKLPATTPVCQGSSTCIVEITFFGADGFLGWNIINGGFKMYVGGGAGLLFPSSNSTNALSQSSIKQTASFDFGAGISFGMGKTMRVPIEVIYSMLPPSQEVSTSMIKILTGLTF